MEPQQLRRCTKKYSSSLLSPCLASGPFAPRQVNVGKLLHRGYTRGMKVILLQDVRGIGRKFDVKEVADGFAQNMLLPRKLAERATSERVKQIEGKRATVLKEREMAATKLKEELKKLSSVSVSVTAPANDQGHLFKGIKEDDIAEALKVRANIELPSTSIVLEAPIKNVGAHTVRVKVGEHSGSFRLEVVKGGK